MAAVTSGSVSTNTYKNSSFYCNWQRESYSESGNYSVINWQAGLYISQSDEWYQNAIKINSLTINGEVVASNVVVSNKFGAGTYQMASGKLTIYHNSDGSKTFSISMACWLYGGHDLSGSGSFELPTIPRYATVNQSLKSKTSTSITMNWSSDSTIDYIWYSKNNGTNWTAVGSVSAKNGSYTIPSLSSSTTYQIKTRVRRQDSQLTTDSTALSVSTYAKTTPTISLSSKTLNSITVSSSCNVTTSSVQYRIKTSSGSYGGYQSSKTFSGLSPNTTYVIEVRAIGKDSGEAGTATLSVTTYNKATISTANNFNLGDSETIKYNNPSGATMAASIYDASGTNSYAGYRTITGSSYTFNFTDAELDTLYKAMKTSNSVSVRIYIRTTSNGVNYYDYKQVSVILTGNQKTIWSNVNSTNKRGKIWMNVSGTWKRAVIWENVSGVWKRGT